MQNSICQVSIKVLVWSFSLNSHQHWEGPLSITIRQETWLLRLIKFKDSIRNQAWTEVKNKYLKKEINVWQINRSNWSRGTFAHVISFAQNSFLCLIVSLYPPAELPALMAWFLAITLPPYCCIPTVILSSSILNHSPPVSRKIT